MKKLLFLAVVACLALTACQPTTAPSPSNTVPPSPTASPSPVPSPSPSEPIEPAPSPHIYAPLPDGFDPAVPQLIHTVLADIDGDGAAEEVKFWGGASQRLVLNYEQSADWEIANCPAFVTAKMGGKTYSQTLTNAEYLTYVWGGMGGGDNFLVGDFDGDGKAEIAAELVSTGGHSPSFAYVLKWNGKGFSFLDLPGRRPADSEDPNSGQGLQPSELTLLSDADSEKLRPSSEQSGCVVRLLSIGHKQAEGKDIFVMKTEITFQWELPFYAVLEMTFDKNGKPVYTAQYLVDE